MKILRKGKHGIPIRDPKVAAKQLSDVQRERGWRVRHVRNLFISFFIFFFYEPLFLCSRFLYIFC